MSERGILFSGDMVRALLDGRKTVTRRTLKFQGISVDGGGTPYTERWDEAEGHAWRRDVPCPYGSPGDRLRVKEHAWMWCERQPNGVTEKGRPKWLYMPLREAPVHYCATHPTRPAVDVVHPATCNVWGWRKKLGRFLPGWASRLTLEVVSVRAERLHAITEEDAIREGITRHEQKPHQWQGFDGGTYDTARGAFSSLWTSINGIESWAANPWVWRVEFKKVEVQRGE